MLLETEDARSLCVTSLNTGMPSAKVVSLMESGFLIRQCRYIIVTKKTNEATHQDPDTKHHRLGV